MEHSENSVERKGNHPAGIVVGIFGFLLFYVLMVGPLIMVYDRMPEPMQELVEIIYTPLEWLDEQLPGEPISKYAELWYR